MSLKLTFTKILKSEKKLLRYLDFYVEYIFSMLF